jgi:hypothetical protein
VSAVAGIESHLVDEVTALARAYTTQTVVGLLAREVRTTPTLQAPVEDLLRGTGGRPVSALAPPVGQPGTTLAHPPRRSVTVACTNLELRESRS